MQLAWYIIGTILLIFILLLCCPLRVKVRWQGGSSFSLVLWILCIPIRLFPLKEESEKDKEKKQQKQDKKKEKEEEKKKKKQQKQDKKNDESSKEEAPEKEKKKSSLSEKIEIVLDLLRSVKKPLLQLKNHITIDCVKLYALVAGEDAKSTALSYAKHWMIFTNAVGILSELVYVKQPDIAVNADYLSNESCYDLSFRFKIKSIFIVAAAFKIAFSFLRQYLSHRPQVKRPPEKKSDGFNTKRPHKQMV